MAASSATLNVTALRLHLHKNGYSPLPLWGKVPKIKKWQELFECPAETIQEWGWKRYFRPATNTGIFSKNVPFCDLDLVDSEAAVVAVKEFLFEKVKGRPGTWLERVGRPPKLGLPFRTDTPFSKLSVKYRTAADPPDMKAKDARSGFEILCDGQQFACFGLHPQTGKPYQWSGGEPGDVPYSDLILITEAEARAWFAEARALIENGPFGLIPIEGKPKPKPGRKPDYSDLQELIDNIDDHNAVRDIANKLVISRVSIEDAITLIQALIKGSPNYNANDPRWQRRLDEIRPATESAYRKFVAPRAGRTVIHVVAGREDMVMREVQDALVAAKCPVFVRAGRLAEPLWRDEKNPDGDTVRSLSLLEYNRSRLIDMAVHNACAFERFDEKKKKFVSCDAPGKIIDALLERGFWKFPTIKGVTCTPTMRPNGTLLTESGYDSTTQLYYKPNGKMTLPKIPEKPTMDDAQKALALLNGLLVGFPFADDKDDSIGLDRSVALAALMTPVLRGAFECAPMFFIAKPEAGTGATFLVKVISALGTGQPAAPLLASEDPKELQKELTAAAFSARPIINLNNLTFDLESGLLCQMTTEGFIEIRLFGRNDTTLKCDCRASTAFANGNNVSVVGDLVRRTVICRLDAKVEEPERRTFDFDPLGEVLRNHAKYLAAVFVVARAYIAAGRPKVEAAKPLAGFEGWMEKVVHPLMWLGAQDPTFSMEHLKALDPKRNTFEDRTEICRNHFPPGVPLGTLGNAFGSDSIHQLAVRKEVVGTAANGSQVEKYAHPDVFQVFSKDGKALSAKSIGWLLKRDVGRVSEGCALVPASEPGNKRATLYAMVRYSGTGPETPL
jgi:hypothetical protein